MQHSTSTDMMASKRAYNNLLQGVSRVVVGVHNICMPLSARISVLIPNMCLAFYNQFNDIGCYGHSL